MQTSKGLKLLLPVAADSVFTSVFLSRIQSPGHSSDEAHSRYWSPTAFSNEESGLQLKRIGFLVTMMMIIMMMTKLDFVANRFQTAKLIKTERAGS